MWVYKRRHKRIFHSSESCIGSPGANGTRSILRRITLKHEARPKRAVLRQRISSPRELLLYPGQFVFNQDPRPTIDGHNEISTFEVLV